jgi:hypothetical protein
LFVATASSRLFAQASGDLVAKIPFDFRVGSSLMPAGTYVFHRSSSLLCVRGIHNGGICQLGLPASPPRNAPENPLLVFHRYEDSYFLASTWSPQEQCGLAVSRGKPEMELARRFGEMSTVALRIK